MTQTIRELLSSVPVVVSPLLPMPASNGEIARRTVRHGFADVLAWLGEDVGPAPHAATHVLAVGNTEGRVTMLLASQNAHDRLARQLVLDHPVDLPYAY